MGPAASCIKNTLCIIPKDSQKPSKRQTASILLNNRYNTSLFIVEGSILLSVLHAHPNQRRALLLITEPSSRMVFLLCYFPFSDLVAVVDDFTVRQTN